jgi:hypothetical protein
MDEEERVFKHLATLRARASYIEGFVRKRDWQQARNNTTWLIATLELLEALLQSLKENG